MDVRVKKVCRTARNIYATYHTWHKKLGGMAPTKYTELKALNKVVSVSGSLWRQAN